MAPHSYSHSWFAADFVWKLHLTDAGAFRIRCSYATSGRSRTHHSPELACLFYIPCQGSRLVYLGVGVGSRKTDSMGLVCKAKFAKELLILFDGHHQGSDEMKSRNLKSMTWNRLMTIEIKLKRTKGKDILISLERDNIRYMRREEEILCSNDPFCSLEMGESRFFVYRCWNTTKTLFLLIRLYFYITFCRHLHLFHWIRFNSRPENNEIVTNTKATSTESLIVSIFPHKDMMLHIFLVNDMRVHRIGSPSLGNNMHNFHNLWLHEMLFLSWVNKDMNTSIAKYTQSVYTVNKWYNFHFWKTELSALHSSRLCRERNTFRMTRFKICKN